MASRLELQKILEDILGSRNVYYTPPGTVTMKYPCVVYKKNNLTQKYADGTTYKSDNRYSVTFIGRDPDWNVPYELLKLPYCSFDRDFDSDNLHHTVFNLYF